MIFWIANDCDVAAVRSYHVTFGYCFRGVVRAFGMNVWFEGKQELFDCWFAENDDVSDRLERCHDFSPFCCRQDWPARALLNCDLFIGVNANDHYVAQLSGASEISNVTNMKHVEAAIRENNSRARLPGRRDALY